MQRFTIVLAALAALVTAGASASPITLQTVVHKEEVVVNDAGERETRLAPVATAVPGDQVVYTLTFANEGDQPATGVTVVDPIPAQMRYVDGSAFGPGTDISFSTDGENFAAAGELRVTNSNGSVRNARADDYTHIRWVFRGELPPGAQGRASFRAVLD